MVLKKDANIVVHDRADPINDLGPNKLKQVGTSWNRRTWRNKWGAVKSGFDGSQRFQLHELVRATSEIECSMTQLILTRMLPSKNVGWLPSPQPK